MRLLSLLLVVAGGQPNTPAQPYPLNYPIDAELSIFGQRKVTQEFPLQNLTFQYGINTYKVSTSVDGGTVTQANSSAVLQTSTSDAGSALLTAKEAIRYVPGQGDWSEEF